MSTGCGEAHSSALRLTQIPSGSVQATWLPSGDQIGSSSPGAEPSQRAAGSGGFGPERTFPLMSYQTIWVLSP